MQVTLHIDAEVLKSLNEGYRAHVYRAVNYWLDEEDVDEALLTDGVFFKGVQRLLERGGPVCATMVEDWIGDDDVYDLIAQLGALGEVRYG